MPHITIGASDEQLAERVLAVAMIEVKVRTQDESGHAGMEFHLFYEMGAILTTNIKVLSPQTRGSMID